MVGSHNSLTVVFTRTGFSPVQDRVLFIITYFLISLKWWPTHLIASLPVTMLGSTPGRGLQIDLKWYPVLRRCLKVSLIFLPACSLPRVSLSLGIWNSQHLDWIKNRIRAASPSASSLMQPGLLDTSNPAGIWLRLQFERKRHNWLFPWYFFLRRNSPRLLKQYEMEGFPSLF